MKMPMPVPTSKLAETALELPESLTQEEGESILQWLARLQGSSSWWLGDLWVFGDGREDTGGWMHGARKALVESDDWHGPTYQTCKTAGTVARAFQRFRRRNHLSFSHHAELASLMAEGFPANGQRLADDLLDWCEEPVRTGGKARTVKELRDEKAVRVADLLRSTSIEPNDIEPPEHGWEQERPSAGEPSSNPTAQEVEASVQNLLREDVSAVQTAAILQFPPQPSASGTGVAEDDGPEAPESAPSPEPEAPEIDLEVCSDDDGSRQASKVADKLDTDSKSVVKKRKPIKTLDPLRDEPEPLAPIKNFSRDVRFRLEMLVGHLFDQFAPVRQLVTELRIRASASRNTRGELQHLTGLVNLVWEQLDSIAEEIQKIKVLATEQEPPPINEPEPTGDQSEE